MNAIYTKLVAFTLYAGLAASAMLPATQNANGGTEKQLRSSHAKRQHPRRDDDLKVNCGGRNKKQALSTLLAKLDPNHPYTIRLTGACEDNISILSFRDITLIAEPGASITDVSGGITPVIYIARTTAFEMQGLTINGQAILCADFSTCYFSGNTFQDSADDGVTVNQSNADFVGDVMQHNLEAGIRAIFGSVVYLDSATLSDNNVLGGFVSYGSLMEGINVTADRNGGGGFRVATHSIMRLDASDTSNNGGDGIFVQATSEAYLKENTIRSNAQAGVRIRDLSMAVFPNGSDVTGNLGGTDVVCEGKFSLAPDASSSISGGTTNCASD